ncbi:DUF6056 family protein [Peptostreptococcus equinus]|uniref:DUF6056 family protein n=1 Tax=Peptostreptococcus equinus TaxID=3003601 RepID=A0ABY7JUD4_9FIRM|nr:DUF6056 family protein [Peptostreptococcus sp. CBA3647]WAW15512.1 DUF6056 family protein [Peptostreptococcus sp. CBA3647]
MKDIKSYLKEKIPAHISENLTNREYYEQLFEKVKENKYINYIPKKIYYSFNLLIEKVEYLLGQERLRIDFAIITALFLVFIFMLILNLYTPFVANDFTNMYVLSTKKIDSIESFFEVQKILYNNINGSFLTNFIGQILLNIDKDLSGFINGIVFMLLVYNIFNFLAKNVEKELIVSDVGLEYIEKKQARVFFNTFSIIYILSIYFYIWYFVPYFGHVFLWLSGTAQYLWISFLFVLYLNYLRKLSYSMDGKISIRKKFLYVFFSFFMGLTNGYIVFIMLILTFYYFALMYIDKRKEIIYIIFMFFNQLIGFIVLITAPSNSKGMDNIYISTINNLISNVSKLNLVIDEYLKILLLVGLLLIVLSRFLSKNKSWEAEIYYISSILCAYSLGINKDINIKAILFPIIILLLSMSISIYRIKDKKEIIAYVLVIIMFLSTAYYNLDTYTLAIKDSKSYYQKYNAREILIRDSKNSGNINNVQIPPIYTANEYNAAYEMNDCSANPKYYLNVALSKYYRVNSIVLR